MLMSCDGAVPSPPGTQLIAPPTWCSKVSSRARPAGSSEHSNCPEWRLGSSRGGGECSTGNGAAKEPTCVTWEHEQWWGTARGSRGLWVAGDKGGRPGTTQIAESIKYNLNEKKENSRESSQGGTSELWPVSVQMPCAGLLPAQRRAAVPSAGGQAWRSH